jgi:Tat protein secretion system quality control protein TatD with DNase activity
MANSKPWLTHAASAGVKLGNDNSPRDVQQSIFIRQLRNAVKLRKPITVHTREAEEDTERTLKEEVPRDHRVSSDDLVGFILAVFDACFILDQHSLLHVCRLLRDHLGSC